MTTTLELLTALNTADADLQSARRDHDWLGVQEAACRIAKLAVQLRAEDMVRQPLVDNATASSWFARMRRATV